MRVCPKCHYVDSLYWRHSIKGYDYAKYDDIKDMISGIAEQLLSQKNVADDDGLYVYHLTKGGNVERWAIMDNPCFDKSWTFPMEHAHKRRTQAAEISRVMNAKRNQRRLLEVIKE